MSKPSHRPGREEIKALARKKNASKSNTDNNNVKPDSIRTGNQPPATAHQRIRRGLKNRPVERRL